MWAKTPYLYTFFMTVHKFSMAEIGILYLVEAVSSLIFGPITGQLADNYGRRKFCLFYNFSIIINLLLIMEGSIPYAYLAQIISGFGGGLLYTTFEAWVVYESEREGIQRPDRFGGGKLSPSHPFSAARIEIRPRTRRFGYRQRPARSRAARF